MRRGWLAIAFLVTALPSGLGLALMTPMGQVADEPAHYARADGLLHFQLIGRRFMFINAFTSQPFPYSGVLASDAILRLRPHWSGKLERCVCSNTVEYFPAFYLPGAAGIAIGRALGASPLWALYAGRIGMLASYLAMGAAALALATRGRAILFVLLSLPMTLSLAASFNQDAQLIAATSLAAALLTRKGRALPALVLLALVACSKPPYSLLLLAAAMPLAAPGFRRRLGHVLIAALAPLAWTGVMLRFSFVPFPRTFYHPGPLWPGSRAVLMQGTSPADNLHVLLAWPAEILLLPVRFLAHNWLNQIHSAIGVLGWLKLVLPAWQYQGWMIAALAALLATLTAPGAAGARPWRGGDAALLAMIVIASLWAMMISLYLSWTEVGAAELTGPSGRYYLPLVPILALALPRLRWARLGRTRAAEFLLTLPGIAMAVIDIFYLPDFIWKSFYIP